MNKSEKIILVTGYFRTIHAGHVRLLRFASSLGENLIVGIIRNTEVQEDVSWQKDALYSLGIISKIEIFNGDIESLVRKIKPNVIVKGLEFSALHNVEADLMNEIGGELIFSSGHSLVEEDHNNKKKVDQLLDFSRIQHNPHKSNVFTEHNLKNLIESFRGLRVCVIGDVILDEFINCRILGLSQEEPLAVASPIDTSRYAGGAAIVAAHQASLGAQTRLLTVMGEDAEARWIADKAKSYGIELNYVQDKNRPTTLKQRYKRGSQTLFKLSRLSEQRIINKVRESFLKLVEDSLHNTDLVVFSDFSYGVVDAELVKFVVEICKNRGIPVCADSQSSSQIGVLSRFSNVDLLTPTEFEARQELRNPNDGLAYIAEELRQRIKAKHLILKLGSDGILLQSFDEKNSSVLTQQIPAFNPHPVDTSGAGDSLLAIASMSLARGANIELAATLGSIGAGIQVSRSGNTPISKEELTREVINITGF